MANPKDLNIGSKVRLLHGTEEGIVTRIISGNNLEIDLGDGFNIPVLASELVLVSPMENRLRPAQTGTLQTTSKTRTDSPAPFSARGIYFVFAPSDNQNVKMHLVNLTDWKLLFVLYGRDGEKNSSLAGGELGSRKEFFINNFKLNEIGEWPVFEMHALFYSDRRVPDKKYLDYSLKCRPGSFFKHLKTAPLLETEAYVFQIDQPGENPSKLTDGPVLREKILSNQGRPEFPAARIVSPEIDLHAEALGIQTAMMENSEILALQLTAFREKLEQCLAAGLDEVLIIHGSGQGKLRLEVHRELSRHPNVASFRDHQKEKFGYGATIARLK